jgi:hypothetical protein
VSFGCHPLGQPDDRAGIADERRGLLRGEIDVHLLGRLERVGQRRVRLLGAVHRRPPGVARRCLAADDANLAVAAKALREQELQRRG